MAKVLLEEMSWFEIREAMDNGYDTVIICAASHEQHGPHLAESTDYIIGLNWYKRVAEKLGHTLVAPVLRPCISPHHMPLPGSITIRPEVFKEVVRDCVAAFVHHGFKKIILASSHGGNFGPMGELAQELDPKYPDTKIVSAMALKDFTDACEEGDRMFGLPKGTCGAHACCLETSIMLYVKPEYVNMDRAVVGYMGTDTAESARLLLANGILGLSPAGILGDPTKATAEMGKAYLDMIVDRTVEIIRKKLG